MDNLFCGQLNGVLAAQIGPAPHIVHLTFANHVTGKITFLEPGIFRYDVDPSGQFAPYAAPRDAAHTAKIQQQPDESDSYSKPAVTIQEDETGIAICSSAATVYFDKATARMRIQNQTRTVMEEAEALQIAEDKTIQTLMQREHENFYGGGTQNGRFVHTGNAINIVNESSWMDGGVASPSPFYFTTMGYGVLRNTFSDGCYDFGAAQEGIVTASHQESHFSAYYFVSDGQNGAQVTQDILRSYYHVTGNPLLLPEYGFYEGHLNCYNRDAWSDTEGSKAWTVKGSAPASGEGVTHYESGMATGYRLTEGLHSESLNGEGPTYGTDNYPKTVDTPYEYSARAVLDSYLHHDMPLGYFLPNDGYGGGYGQNGYYMQGGVNEDGSSTPERIAAVDANIDNLARFSAYTRSKGVAAGLWTESNLAPDADPNTFWHLLRDFKKEVTVGGATTLKTDVAWVGPGYSFQLNGVKTAYDIVTTAENFRPNIISLDGWAGSQRFNSVWSGDQTGGNWEYIRFHIPTYIGSSLSGNPNIGSDMDGIFGGRALIAARDFQWKAFTPQMLNMDGWGTYMKSPFTFGDPYTGINRMYMKIKARLMPYIYTSAVSASNIDTGNNDTGLPMVRAMFLEYPEDAYAYSKAMQYQFMLGSSILVAPIYQDTAADELGNDVRNNIYLPDPDQVWVDYLTGEKYQGGQILNNFAAPLWKLPVFVKSGAILPMYEENNTPDSIDKTQRFVEFWPDGSSRYTVYEDDGKYIQNQTEEDAAYGTIDHVSYGPHLSTTYTSNLEGDVLTLTVEPSTGGYPGYDSFRDTILVVNLSDEPEDIAAYIGDTPLIMGLACSQYDFDSILLADDEAFWYYEDAAKLRTYAPKSETELAAMVADVHPSPKLYIKLPPVDIHEDTLRVTITGYVNDIHLMADMPNPQLTAPTLTVSEEEKTSASITLHWTASEDASAYEMLVDGKLYTMGNALSYVHDDLAYNSSHTYQVRAHNEDGYSEWSAPLTTATLSDPWRNEIGAQAVITWEGGDEAGSIKYATDHSLRGLFFSVEDVVGKQFPFIYDFGKVYELDKFEYYPRDSYGSGCVEQMNISSSLDGVHWKLEWDGAHQSDWTYDIEQEVEQNGKTVSLSGVSARYLKLEIIKSKRGYFAAHELPVYKKDGSAPFAVGSTNKNETVSEGDYTNMKNYLGTSIKDGSNFVDQIQKRSGDINMNGIYDVYDYAYTMFQLDGGTQQTGAVSGRIQLRPSSATVKAGETFTLDVYAEDVANLNAFGKVLHYDPRQLSFGSIIPTDSAAQMENLTVNKTYTDGTAYINLAFANRGDQPLYTGTGSLASITLTALTDLQIDQALELNGTLLIGPAFDTVEA